MRTVTRVVANELCADRTARLVTADGHPSSPKGTGLRHLIWGFLVRRLS